MNSQDQQDKAFDMIRRMLEPRIGEELAITIDSLATGSGLCDSHIDPVKGMVLKPRRRTVEHILETRFGDFPFLVISSSKGYFRPATEEECNQWWASCHSRIRAIAMRMKAGRERATTGGFRYIGTGRFEKVRPLKNDLFE